MYLRQRDHDTGQLPRGSQSNPVLTGPNGTDRDIMSNWAWESAYACGRKAGRAKRASHR
jgi:hypothetical protein